LKEPPRLSSGALLVLVAATLWSTNGVAIKYVDAGPVLIAAVRALVAGLVTLPFLRFRELKPSWPLAGLLFSYSLMSWSFVSATKLTAAANAISLQYTAPLWIFAAGLVMGSVRLSGRRAAPMALVLFGIIAFLMEPVQGTSFTGNVLGIVSGIGFALVTVFYRALRDTHNLTLVSATNLCAAIVLFPLIGEWSEFGSLAVADWGALFYLGAFQMGSGYIFYSLGLKRISSLRAATIALLEPVLNPIWVVLFIGEVPTVYGIFGALLILTGVLADTRLNKEVEGMRDKNPAPGPEQD